MRLTATRLHTIHGFPTPHWTSFVQRAHHALGPCEKPSCLSTGGVGALSSWLDMSLSLCALLGYVGEYYGGPFPWEGTRVKDDGGLLPSFHLVLGLEEVLHRCQVESTIWGLVVHRYYYSGTERVHDPGGRSSVYGEEPAHRSQQHVYPSYLSLIHISEPTRLRRISYAVFCLKKKKKKKTKKTKKTKKKKKNKKKNKKKKKK